MKSSFGADAWSLARAAGLVAAVALAAASPARAAPARGLACMEAYDLACARAELGDGEDGPNARLRAEIAGTLQCGNQLLLLLLRVKASVWRKEGVSCNVSNQLHKGRLRSDSVCFRRDVYFNLFVLWSYCLGEFYYDCRRSHSGYLVFRK